MPRRCLQKTTGFNAGNGEGDGQGGAIYVACRCQPTIKIVSLRTTLPVRVMSVQAVPNRLTAVGIRNRMIRIHGIAQTGIVTAAMVI